MNLALVILPNLLPNIKQGRPLQFFFLLITPQPPGAWRTYAEASPYFSGTLMENAPQIPSD